MKFFIIVLIMCFSVVAQFSVKALERKSGAKMEYKSNQELIKDLNKRAKLEIWPDIKLQRNLQITPINGYLLITTHGRTIGAAVPKYWEFIVTDESGEILRETGQSRIPSYSRDNWYSLNLIRLPDDLSFPITVYVVSRILGQRSVFVISED